jgi:CHAD domain-containing protein
MAAAAHPVPTLRKLVTELEAAITLTLADPKRKSVHRLRTTTRRIEAQLELLALLPDLPEHARPAKKARRLLRKLRRAAGRVRDLDVQRALIQSRSHEALKLRALFKQQRGGAAESLLSTLHQYQSKLARALEELLKTLEPIESVTIPATHLVRLTLSWYADHASSATQRDHRQLHDVRKAAKLARYIAESANAPASIRLARSFESLQQAGGDWHDWLTLSRIARRELGPASTLAQSFAGRCERSLSKYLTQLKAFPKISLANVEQHPRE